MAYTEIEAKELVIEAGKRLVETGLITRTWGNISARISDTQFVVTPSGRAYETLTPEQIVVVNIADGTYEGDIKPSGEKGIHLDAYRLHPDVNFVIHTHQAEASAISVLEKNMEISEKNRKLLGDTVPCAKYAMCCTPKLQKNVEKVTRKYPEAKAILLKYHGTLCMGATFEEAFAVAECLEAECEKQYKKSVTGFALKRLNPDEMRGSSVRTENGFLLTKNGEETEYKTPVNPKEVSKEVQIHQAIYEDGEIQSVQFAQTPYIRLMARQGKDMRPYLEDLAQIAGVNIKCMSYKKNSVEEIAAALKDTNAVLIEGEGAICTGTKATEAEAVAMVLEKGSQTALLALCKEKIPPIKKRIAKKERDFYLSSYSKMKK